MTPVKVLTEYLKDIEDQEWVALNVPNKEEAKKISLIAKDFKAAINLISFYKREGYIK
jgi:hypothetical protein